MRRSDGDLTQVPPLSFFVVAKPGWGSCIHMCVRRRRLCQRLTMLMVGYDTSLEQLLQRRQFDQCGLGGRERCGAPKHTRLSDEAEAVVEVGSEMQGKEREGKGIRLYLGFSHFRPSCGGCKQMNAFVMSCYVMFCPCCARGSNHSRPDLAPSRRPASVGFSPPVPVPLPVPRCCFYGWLRNTVDFARGKEGSRRGQESSADGMNAPPGRYHVRCPFSSSLGLGWCR